MSMSDITLRSHISPLPQTIGHGDSLIRSTRATTILLVEDDRSLRRYLEVVLQRAGYTVITATDGLEAMKATLAAVIDLVITDAIMPHLNGYEFCRFLRRHPQLSRLPIVLLSAADQQQHAHASSSDQAERADVYLSKPVRPEELTNCIARLLPQANRTATRDAL